MSIFINANPTDLSAAAQTLTYELQISEDVDASSLTVLATGNATWCKPSLDGTTLTLVLSANTRINDRKTTLNIRDSDGDVLWSRLVSQRGGGISTSVNGIYVGDSGGVQTVNIDQKGSGVSAISCGRSKTWFSASISDSTISVNVSDNTGGAARYGYVSLTAKPANAWTVFYIYQSWDKVVLYGGDDVSFPSEGGKETAELEVGVNTGILSISTSADWISAAIESVTSENDGSTALEPVEDIFSIAKLAITVAANTAATEREGSVTVSSENGGSAEVWVIQRAGNGDDGGEDEGGGDEDGDGGGNVRVSPRAMVFAAGTQSGEEIAGNPLTDKTKAPMLDFASAEDGSALTASSSAAWIETAGDAFGVASLGESDEERAGTVLVTDADGTAASVAVEQKRLDEFSITTELEPFGAPARKEWAEHFEFNPDEVKIDWAAGEHPLRLLIHDGETEDEQREIYDALEFAIEYENGERANRSGWLSVRKTERAPLTVKLTIAPNTGDAGREGEIVFAGTDGGADTRIMLRQSGKTALADGAATPGGEVLVPYLRAATEIVCPAAGGEVEAPLPFGAGAGTALPACPDWASAAIAGGGSAFERSCVYIDVAENKIDDYDATAETAFDLISRSAVITARWAMPAETDGGEETVVERRVRVTQRTLSMDVRALALGGYFEKWYVDYVDDDYPEHWEAATQTAVVSRLACGRVTVPATPPRVKNANQLSDDALMRDCRQVLRVCDDNELAMKRLVLWEAGMWREQVEKYGRGDLWNDRMSVCDAPDGTSATQLYFTAVCGGGKRWGLIDEGRSGYLYIFNFSKRCENLILRNTAVGIYDGSTDQYLHTDTAISAPADAKPTIVKLSRKYPDADYESIEVLSAETWEGGYPRVYLNCPDFGRNGNHVAVIPSTLDDAMAASDGEADTKPTMMIFPRFIVNRERRAAASSGEQDELCAGALPAAASGAEAPRLDFEANPGASVFRARHAWSATKIETPLPDWVLSESGFAPAASGQIGAAETLEFVGTANATCNYTDEARSFVFSRKIVIDPDMGVYDVASVRVRQARIETDENAAVEASPESVSFGMAGGTQPVSVRGNAAAGALHGYVEENSLYPVTWLDAGTSAITAAPNDYAARSARATYRGWFGGEATVEVSQEAFSGATTLGLEFVPRKATFSARGGKFRFWILRRGNSIATLMQRIRLRLASAGWLDAVVQNVPGQDDAETGALFMSSISCVDVEVAPNADAAARTANLIAGYDGGAAGNIEISQDGAETEAGGGNGTLSLSETRLSFGAEETAARAVAVTKDSASADYGELSATTDADWLDVSLSADGATLNVRPVSAAPARRTAFVFVSGANCGFAWLFVEQEGSGEEPPGPQPNEPSISAGTDALTFGKNGGATTVAVTANAAAGAVRAETSAAWLTAEMLAGGASVSIRAEANTGASARTGTIWLRGENGGETAITVTQTGKTGELPAVSAQPAELTFGASGGEQTVKISANAAAGAISWRFEGDGWRWLTAELSADGATLRVTAAENARGETARDGTIVVYGENGGLATLTARQYAFADSDGLRLIPWSVSDGTAYVLLISTSGGEQTLKIYDAGTRAEVASFPCDYPQESLSAIRWKSSNDVIWLTHPERPVMQATRSDAWDADGTHSFAFAFERYPFVVEPMLDWNVGATPLTLTAERYRRTAWERGAIVYNGDSFELSAAHLSYDVEKVSEGVYNVVAGCRFAEPSDLDSIPDGAAIQLFGLSFKIFSRVYYTDGNGYFESSSDVTAYSYTNPRGTLRKLTGVVGSDGGYFEVVVDQIHLSAGSTSGNATIQIGAALKGTADLPVVEKEFKVDEEFYAEANALAPGFYESLIDNNTSDLTDAAAWRRTFCVGKELRLYGASVEDWRVGQHFALTAKAYSATSGSWGVDAEGEISESLLAFGSVTLKTEGGVWSGRLVLEQSLDDGETWEFLDAIVSENGSSNPKITVDVDELGALVRVRCDRRETATTRQALIPSDGGTVTYKEVENDTGCKWSLTCEGYSDVYVKVKSLRWFSGDKSDAFLVVECISGCPYPVSTTTWAEGAWCSRYGYPRTVTLHEERLCFAGNVKRPATLWCSAINHYDDFRRGTLDTSALSVKPTAHSYGRAAWLASGRQLLLGTTLEEFAVGSRDAVAAMSGSNIVAKSSASYGSADADCVTTREGIFTVLPGRRKIGALKYDMVEEYTGTEVSQRAETLLAAGVKELAHVRAPQDVLFALCEDGTVAALTYDFAQNVAGWSRLTVLDGVATLCAVRRGERDVLVLAAASRGEVLLGEIDLGGDVWTDDGIAYESVCEPMPMPVYSDEPHGTTGKVAQADVYLTAGTVFDYSFDGGGRVHHMVAKGRDGNAKALFGRIELGQSGDWTDEATVVFSTSYAGPFVIAAVGAEIKVGG